MTSFYDLDYLINLNEKRMEQYEGSFRKIVDQFTFLMVIYTAVTIFLVPIVQTIFFSGIQCHWLHCLSFYLFCALMLYSLFYAVKLLIPAKYLHLLEPRDYYGPHREYYEGMGFGKDEVDTLKSDDMEKNTIKLSENASHPPVNLPGVRNELVVNTGNFGLRWGADLGFLENIWDGIKKLAHKLGVR